MSERSRYGAKRWRGLEYDYDAAIVPAECSYLICLSDREIELLLANVHYLRSPQRWYSPTGAAIDPETILYIANEIQRALMSRDCGCGSQVISRSDDDRFIFEISMVDDGTVASYAPYAPDTRFDYDSGDTTPAEEVARYNTLCNMVNDYIDNLLARLEADVYATAPALVVVGIIATLVNPILGIIIGALSSVATALYSQLYENEAAIEKVKCCMLSSLRGQNVDIDIFKGSVADCEFTFGSVEAQLADWVNDQNQFEANFRAFMVYLGNSYPAPSDEACAYCNEDWCYDIDLTAASVPAWLDIVEGETSAGAERTVGVGYHALNTGEQIAVQVLLQPGSRLNTFAVQLTGGSGTLGLYTNKRDGTLDTSSWGNSSGWALQSNITDLDPSSVKMVAIYDYALTRLYIAGSGSPPFGASEPTCGFPP